MVALQLLKVEFELTEDGAFEGLESSRGSALFNVPKMHVYLIFMCIYMIVKN